MSFSWFYKQTHCIIKLAQPNPMKSDFKATTILQRSCVHLRRRDLPKGRRQCLVICPLRRVIRGITVRLKCSRLPACQRIWKWDSVNDRTLPFAGKTNGNNEVTCNFGLLSKCLTPSMTDQRIRNRCRPNWNGQFTIISKHLIWLKAE